MSAKRRKFDTRTILIILLVVVIIAAGYILITNAPPEDDTLTPEEVIRNPSKYLEQSIIVRGHYVFSAGDDVVVSTLSTIGGRAELIIDHSKVENASDILITGIDYVYKFTGILKLDEENPLNIQYILIVDKIDEN